MMQLLSFVFFSENKKMLLSLRLQSVKINNENLFDIKPDMSWCIPAIAAEPVVVARPRWGCCHLETSLFWLQKTPFIFMCGSQGLCRYMLPSSLGKGQVSDNLMPSETVPILHDLKIIGLVDAVDRRIYLTVNNGQIFRCAL